MSSIIRRSLCICASLTRFDPSSEANSASAEPSNILSISSCVSSCCTCSRLTSARQTKPGSRRSIAPLPMQRLMSV